MLLLMRGWYPPSSWLIYLDFTFPIRSLSHMRSLSAPTWKLQACYNSHFNQRFVRDSAWSKNHRQRTQFLFTRNIEDVITRRNATVGMLGKIPGDIGNPSLKVTACRLLSDGHARGYSQYIAEKIKRGKVSSDCQLYSLASLRNYRMMMTWKSTT